MTEKQPWLRVVGGRDLEPKVEERIPEIKDSSGITPHQLLMLFTDTVGKMPADFGQSVNARLLERYQSVIKSYTCGQLYNYLLHPDIWIHPTFTKATLDEVLARKDLGDYSPRDVAK